MPDTTQTKPVLQQVIVLERRSLLSQLGSIWCLATPVIITFWICLPRAEFEESPPEKLNLPRTDWWHIRKPAETRTSDNPTVNKSSSILNFATAPTGESQSGTVSNDGVVPVAVALDPAINLANPPDKGTSLVSTEVTPKTLIGNGLPAINDNLQSGNRDTPNRQPDLLEGTVPVVADVKVMNLNPVTVFDPQQKAAKDEAKKLEPGKTAVSPAEELGKSSVEPGKVDSSEALAEIEEQARKNRAQISSDLRLKPLLAMHDAEQAKQKANEFQEALKRRNETNRGPFRQKLATIVEQSGPASDRIEAINSLILDDLGPIDPHIFQPVLVKLDVPGRSISTASKIRLLRKQNIPESIILSYLIQLAMRELGKTNGPRNAVDAKLQSARLLLRITN